MALTGGIASGKSTVARRFGALGAVIVDADALAREVVEPGTPALARIAQEFGPRVIGPDGALDRAVLGSIVFGDDPETQFPLETGRTFATTTLATMAAILGWLLVERLVHKKATSLGAASGIVAGLVAITPATGAVNLSGAVAIGAIAGAVCAWAVGLKYKLGYDDSLDVVGVHLVGGLVGTIGIGLIATAAAPTGVDGLLYGGGAGQLGRQLLGAGVVLAYALVVSGIIGIVVDKVLGFRIHEEHEVTGIDLVVHAETAYDLHATAGTRAGGHGILASITQPSAHDPKEPR